MSDLATLLKGLATNFSGPFTPETEELDPFIESVIKGSIYAGFDPVAFRAEVQSRIAVSTPTPSSSSSSSSTSTPPKIEKISKTDFFLFVGIMFLRGPRSLGKSKGWPTGLRESMEETKAKISTVKSYSDAKLLSCFPEIISAFLKQSSIIGLYRFRPHEYGLTIPAAMCFPGAQAMIASRNARLNHVAWNICFAKTVTNASVEIVKLLKYDVIIREGTLSKAFSSRGIYIDDGASDSVVKANLIQACKYANLVYDDVIKAIGLAWETEIKL
jgi:hypothetical protein